MPSTLSKNINVEVCFTSQDIQQGTRRTFMLVGTSGFAASHTAENIKTLASFVF